MILDFTFVPNKVYFLLILRTDTYIYIYINIYIHMYIYTFIAILLTNEL